MLDAMVEKYAAGEYAAIHAAVGRKARNGDIEAIKMYREMQSSGGSDEVVIVDESNKSVYGCRKSSAPPSMRRTS